MVFGELVSANSGRLLLYANGPFNGPFNRSFPLVTLIPLADIHASCSPALPLRERIRNVGWRLYE